MILKYFYNYKNDKSLEEDTVSIDNKVVFDGLTKKYCRSLNIAFHMALESQIFSVYIRIFRRDLILYLTHYKVQ